MTSAVEALIKGKPKIVKRGFRNNWTGPGHRENYIYLLSVDGDTTKFFKGGAYSISTVKNMTQANATIYDELTDRMSTCSVYKHENGKLFFKKNGITYYLDTFK